MPISLPGISYIKRAKMKKLYSRNTAVVIIIIILFSCKKSSVDNITTPPPPPPLGVTASVAGRVIDLNNAPVSSASVAAGGSATTTDANGQFTFKDIQLDKDAGFVKVTKADHFTGSRTFLVNANTTSNIKIQMIPKAVSGIIASSSGGNVDVTGGAKINLTGGSFVNEGSNTAYSGDVSVAGYYLNPADANFREYMPGDLRGISTANKEGILKSFGMLSVEMNDAGGQKLQLATGRTATITIPIPLTMQAAAPTTIPLWYFDEAKGIWKQEGTATKQSNDYAGTVTHFSFWTAGQLAQSVRLDATFKDSLGNALDNKQVYITLTGSSTNSADSSTANGTTEAYTNSAGTVSSLIPANTTLIMKVLDQYGVIYTQSIGPFNTDTNLGVITITNLVTVTLSGTVVDCNNNPVTTGSVNVTIPADNYQFSSEVINGNFTTTFDRPNSSPTTATIYVVDKTTIMSATKVVTITRGNQNIGPIKVCASPVAGFTYSVGNTSLPVTVTFNNTSTNSTSWSWVFGDGYSSLQQNPTHVYTTYGNLLVTLTATGPGGSNTISKVLTISGTVDSSYINLTMNGATYIWASPDIGAYHADTSAGNTTYIYASSASSPFNHINFEVLNDNASPGNYNITLSANINGKSYPNNNATTTVTEYGLPGGNIIGTSSGQLLDSTTNIPFTLAYKVKRNR